MIIILGIFVFILGLCFGSFINMLEYRLAKKYGLIKFKFSDFFKKRSKDEDVCMCETNRSFCDGCGRQLKGYENIPVLSWVIQGGRTRCCHKKLPISYPIVELLTGILFLAFFWMKVFPNLDNGFILEIPGMDMVALRMGLGLLMYLIIIVCLIFSAFFDLKHMILPDKSTIVFVVCGLFLLVLSAMDNSLWSPVWQNIITALIASGFLGSLYLITRGKGMGLGDVKFALFMGLFLGWQKTIIAFYVAFIVGAIVGVGLILGKKANRTSLIPFGPFLILGTFVAWWGGAYILDLIQKWF